MFHVLAYILYISTGYYFGLVFFERENSSIYDWLPWKLSIYWQLYVTFSVTLILASVILALYWKRRNWSNHPMVRTLQHHAPTGSSWTAVASSINVEFRRIDKFTTGIIGRRMIVTDSWVMKTSTYSVHIAQQQDVHLTLTGTEEHDMSHENYVGVQYLSITVNSVNAYVKPFTIRWVIKVQIFTYTSLFF